MNSWCGYWSRAPNESHSACAGSQIPGDGYAKSESVGLQQSTIKNQIPDNEIVFVAKPKVLSEMTPGTWRFTPMPVLTTSPQQTS